jgi:hypothetical protein
MQLGIPFRDFADPRAPLRLPGRARQAAVAALVAVACLPPSRAAAQRTASASLVGVVRNQETHVPVPGAIARLEWTGKSVAVDSDGRFELTGLVPGPELLQIRAIGYRIGSWAVNLAESTVVSKTFDMVEVPIVLPELTATTTPPLADWRSPEGFELRRQRGEGYFISEEQIKEQQPRTLVEVLRTVPGVYTFCDFRTCRVLMLRSTPPCQPEYFLDGYPASHALGPDFPIQGIRGIEIYGDVFSTPIEFQRLGLSCGVIAVWTRMGR